MSSTGLVLKNDRQKCWLARDQFWDCVQKLHGDFPDADEKSLFAKCSKQRTAYELACPKTWVSLFDQKRGFELFKKKRFENDMLSSAAKQ